MSLLKKLDVPVFTAGGMPAVETRDYLLRVTGLVGGERSFSWEAILAMPKSRVNCRLISVSGWSVRADWDGVRWGDFVKEASPLSEGRFVRFTSLGGGYVTVVPREDLGSPRVVLAFGVNGDPIEREYGGPLRMVIPNLWGYKSAKWLGQIDFIGQMEGGYWEDRGYTRSGIIEPGMTLDLNTKTQRPIPGGEVMDF